MEQEFDEYDCEDFDPYGFIASLPPLIPSNRMHPCLPPKDSNAPPITLVLDLDETLVHCSTDPNEVRNPDFVFHVEFHGTIYTVNAKKRPGVHEFLEYVKNKFEVVIFTGSALRFPLRFPEHNLCVRVLQVNDQELFGGAFIPAARDQVHKPGTRRRQRACVHAPECSSPTASCLHGTPDRGENKLTSI